jgi:hypothetical protein
MGAIRNHFDIDTAMDCILAADIDLTLICHKGPAQARAFARTCAWLAKEAAHRQYGLYSAQRIMRFKQQYLDKIQVIRPKLED